MRLSRYSVVLGLTLLAKGAWAQACFDRTAESHHFIVDSHLHFQPFSGPSLEHERLIGYLKDAGIQYANVYGIGQTRIEDWACIQHRDCSGDSLIKPTMKNDFINAKNITDHPQNDVRLTLSMTFPDLQNPAGILDRMHILDEEFPGYFQWMGESNVVKQALFRDGHEPATEEDIKNWSPFMAELRRRNMPLALHSDFGNDDDPTQYLHLMKYILETYPDNTIVWMHLGMSREQQDIDPKLHTEILDRLMKAHSNLWLDVSWSVLYDYYFSDTERRPYYVDLLNTYSDRVLTGTDIVASEYSSANQYNHALERTSYINQFLSDKAFRDIALGQSYFELLGLDVDAPEICQSE